MTNFYHQGSGCILRVFTDQIVNKIVVKELYGFYVSDENGIVGAPSDILEEAHNTNYDTGKALTPEKNVVYCDTEGNKIPSWDLV